VIYKNINNRRGLSMTMENNKNSIVEKTVKTGISFGSALAIVISYTTYQSIGWAIFHGILGWLYVAYYIFNFGWS
jgi:hypothetical protein